MNIVPTWILIATIEEKYMQDNVDSHTVVEIKFQRFLYNEYIWMDNYKYHINLYLLPLRCIKYIHSRT